MYDILSHGHRPSGSQKGKNPTWSRKISIIGLSKLSDFQAPSLGPLWILSKLHSAEASFF